MQMKTGLFFGSFNPIHIGHLAIANYMKAFTDLDEVWFVVSPQNPLKQKDTLLAEHHRLALVETAIGEQPGYRASNIEFKLPKPSYTINTLTYIQEKHPDREFVLIMGSDNLATFHKWKNYEQILEQYELYIYPRKEAATGGLFNHPKVKITEAPLMEISSTFLRDGIREKKDVAFFFPPQVYEYIQEMHFYKSKTTLDRP